MRSRLNMTPEERRNILAYETEDVAREDQIFLNDALGMSASMEEGKDISKMETPIFKSKGGFVNLSEAEKWAKENLQSKSFKNKFTGEEISISGRSIAEMLNPNTTKKINERTHMAALMSVPEFIQTGIPAEIHADTHGRNFDVMRLYNAIEISGEIYRVKSTVKRLKEGNKYYTYELQKMELIEDTHMTTFGLDSNTVLNSTNSITGAKLLKGVKKQILPNFY